MICAYNELYLNDAKENLAEFFDYAINSCKFDADFFAKLFVQSGYADKFERGNPAIIAGMSGIELAKKVKDHRDEIKQKLNEFGAPSVTKLNPEKYNEMIEFLNTL